MPTAARPLPCVLTGIGQEKKNYSPVLFCHHRRNHGNGCCRAKATVAGLILLYERSCLTPFTHPVSRLPYSLAEMGAWPAGRLAGCACVWAGIRASCVTGPGPLFILAPPILVLPSQTSLAHLFFFFFLFAQCLLQFLPTHALQARRPSGNPEGTGPRHTKRAQEAFVEALKSFCQPRPAFFRYCYRIVIAHTHAHSNAHARTHAHTTNAHTHACARLKVLMSEL